MGKPSWWPAPVLNPFEPRSAKGGVAHLDQYQTYRRPEQDHAGALLFVSINDLLLQMVDENGPLTPSECPVVGTAPCSSIQSIVRFRVRAYLKGGAHDFFEWVARCMPRGTSTTGTWMRRPCRTRAAVLPLAQLAVDNDLDHNGSQRIFQLQQSNDPNASSWRYRSAESLIPGGNSS